jgi:hypothetical protein
VRNLGRGGRLERVKPISSAGKTLEGSEPPALVLAAAKPRRGRKASANPGEERDIPREVKPMRAAVSRCQLRLPRETRTLAGSKTLKWRSSDQPQEGNGGRKTELLCGWKQALKGNPKGGTGMKQGRQMAGGARPRECEKHCGGNTTQGRHTLGAVAARHQEDAEGEQIRMGGAERS